MFIRRSLFGRAILAAFALAIAPAPVLAATLDAGQILNQFNLVVFGNHHLNSQVHGRSFVGGNLSGSGSMTTGNYTLPDSDFDDVNVAGSASDSFKTVAGASVAIGGANSAGMSNVGRVRIGGSNSGTIGATGAPRVEVGGSNSGTINNAGSVRMGGSNTGTINNTPVETAVPGIPDLALDVAPFRDAMTAKSQALRNLDATGNATEHDQGVRFEATPIGGLSSYNIAASDLTGNELDVVLNGADTVVINVSGTDITLGQNFNSNKALGSNVLWNFFEATDLKLNNRFVGAVLAPNAAFTNGNNVFGSVVVNSFIQGGQIHQQAWQGTLPSDETPSPVPLPAAAWLLLAGIGGLGIVARRKRMAA